MGIFKDIWVENLLRSNKNLTEEIEFVLTVLFDSKEQMMQRIYEKDLKLKFGKFYKHTKYIKNKDFTDGFGFEVVFKSGNWKDLEKIVKYIVNKLDKKNQIYYHHTIRDEIK